MPQRHNLPIARHIALTEKSRAKLPMNQNAVRKSLLSIAARRPFFWKSKIGNLKSEIAKTHR
jgi:hypothetical protein